MFMLVHKSVYVYTCLMRVERWEAVYNMIDITKTAKSYHVLADSHEISEALKHL